MRVLVVMLHNICGCCPGAAAASLKPWTYASICIPHSTHIPQRLPVLLLLYARLRSISLIIPAAMHGVLLARTPDAPGWALAVDVGIAVLGIVCAIAGASSAANSLQSKLAAAACAAA